MRHAHRTFALLAVLVLGASCTSKPAPQTVPLQIQVIYPTGLNVPSDHSYTFTAVEVNRQANVTVHSVECGGHNCQATLDLDPGFAARGYGHYLINVLDRGTLVGLSSAQVQARNVTTGRVISVQTSPVALATAVIYKLHKKTRLDATALAMALASEWGITIDSSEAFGEFLNRTAVFAITSGKSTLSAISSDLEAVAARGFGTGTSAPGNTNRSVQVEPKLALGSWLRSLGTNPLAAGVTAAIPNWGSFLAAIGIHIAQDVYGNEREAAAKAWAVTVSTQLNVIQNEIMFVWDEITIYAAVAGADDLADKWNAVVADAVTIGDVMGFWPCTYPLAKAAATTTKDPDPNQTDINNALMSCLDEKSPTVPNKTNLDVITDSLVDRNFMVTGTGQASLNPPIQGLLAIANCFEPNVISNQLSASSCAGDLIIFANANYGTTGLAALLKGVFPSSWIQGPLGASDEKLANAIINLIAQAQIAFLDYKTMGDFIIKAYPTNAWVKKNGAVFDAWFLTQAQFDAVQTFFSGTPYSPEYMSFFQVYKDDVSKSMANQMKVGLFPQEGASLGVNSPSKVVVRPTLSAGTSCPANPPPSNKEYLALGKCVITDYSQTLDSTLTVTNRAVWYQCDSSATDCNGNPVSNPYKLLNLSQCRSNVTNGFVTYPVWYVNATGNVGDTYLACDDTLVGSNVGANIGGGQKAMFVGYAQHPFSISSSLGGSPAFMSGTLPGNVHNTSTIFSQTGNHPTQIVVQTPTNGYADLIGPGSGFGLVDQGSNTIYSALIRLQDGSALEVAHNFLGTNGGFQGTNLSEIYIRCPLSSPIDCRPRFNNTSARHGGDGSGSYYCYDNGVNINGNRYWLSSSLTEAQSDWSIYNPANGDPVPSLQSSFSDYTAYLWSEPEPDIVALGSPTLVYGQAFPAFLPNIVYKDNKLIPGQAFGGQYFAAGDMHLPLNSAIRVRQGANLGYQLVMQNDENLVLYQCTQFDCSYGFPIWATNTAGGGRGVTEASFTSDGYLILQNAAGVVLWFNFGGSSPPIPRTRTQCGLTSDPSPKAIFAVQDDGNLVIYDCGALPNPFGNGALVSSGTSIWSHGSNGWPTPASY